MESDYNEHEPCTISIVHLRRQLAAMTGERDAAVAESARRKDALVSIAKLYDETLAAIVQTFKHISDDGGVAGMDWIGNYLNGVDAVQEGDEDIWQSARDRLALDSTAQPAAGQEKESDHG